jgi:diphthamide biosynthesis enzyme Dph1/Dph2-like protein
MLDKMPDYDLELEEVVSEIIREKAKTVLIQLPDGLKPKTKEIKAFLDEKLGKKVKVLFWAESCFGACDLPLEAEKLGVDLVVQFGHSEWK